MIQTITALIALLLAPAPNRALYKDTEACKELATMFVAAGEKYNLEPDLLTVWSFGESSFRPDAKGAIGEVGLFQVHGVAKKTCLTNGFDLATMKGQIYCGALLIDMSRRYCGDLTRGLYRYASGKCNGTPKAKRIVKRRFRQLERLRKELSSGEKWMKKH